MLYYLGAKYKRVNYWYSNRKFINDRRRELVDQGKVISLVGSFLILFCTILDYFYYPDKFIIFFIYRLVVSLSFIFIYSLFFIKKYRKYYRFLLILVPFISCLMISQMIYETEDQFNSIYYIGILLTIIGPALIYISDIFTVLSIIIVNNIVFGIYLFLMLDISDILVVFNKDNAAMILLVYVIFLLCFDFVTLVGSYIGFSTVVTEYIQRRELKKSFNKEKKTRTSLEKAQNKLVESEKMMTLGRLTANLAHEINNNLNYFNGTLYGLKKKINKYYVIEDEDKKSLITKNMTDLEEAAHQINRIINDLREFSVPNTRLISKFDLRELFETSIKFTKTFCSTFNVKVDIELKDEIIISADRSKILQVLINFIRNACQAIGKDHTNGNGKIILRGDIINKKVKLSIIDNGSGIPQEIQSKILEPFFTTKEQGDGMGLGLSLCKKIVESLNGTLGFNSKVGKGTSFFIYLPI